MKIKIKDTETGELRELTEDQYVLPDNVKLVDTSVEPSKREFLTKDETNKIVQDRMAEQRTALEAEYSTHEHFEKLLEQQGFEYEDTGLISPKDEEKKQTALLDLYETWRKREGLERKEALIAKFTGQGLAKELNDLAPKHRFKEEATKSLPGGKTMLQIAAEELGTKFSEPEGGFFQFDGDKPVAPLEKVVEKIASDPNYAWMLKDTGGQDAGVSTAGANGKATGMMTDEEADKALADGTLSQAEYNERYRKPEASTSRI